MGMRDSNSDPYYALGKLGIAVELLATAPQQVRWRVANALVGMAMLYTSDMPTDELRRDFEELWRLATRRQPTSVEEKGFQWGSLHATAEHSRNSTASRLASRIVDLESRLRAHLYDMVRRY